MVNRLNFWSRLSTEWRFAISTFLVARVFLWLWSLVVYAIFPAALSNLELSGEPVLAFFNLHTGERVLYSRQVGGEVLTFRALDANHSIDLQTGSVWSMQSGQALEGRLSGTNLSASSRDVEEVFPYLGVPPARGLLLSLWQRFDVNWYLKIAGQGYHENDGSTVYFPIYPMLVRGVSLVLPPMLAAVMISNAALIAALALLYRLFSRISDETVARRALVYFLIFPSAFFLTVAYSESLFLLFCLASFDCASQRQWGWAALWGAFSALTRLQGVLMVIPLVYMLWRELRGTTLSIQLLRALPLGVIPLATLCFQTVTNMSILNVYEGMLRAQFVLPWENVWAAFSLALHGSASAVDVINLLVTVGLVAAMFTVWKKLPFEYTLYALLMFVAPMLRMTTTQSLVSMLRYALVIFPVFFVLGSWGRNPWVNRMVLYLSFPLQLYLSAQFILWGWVA